MLVVGGVTVGRGGVEGASDHRPVMITLTLPDAEEARRHGDSGDREEL